MSEGAALTDHARALYAERAYPQLAELLGALSREELLANAQLGFWLADAWRRTGRQKDALELVQAIASATLRAGLPRLEHDRLNLLGMLHFETGNVPGAEEAWRALLARASAAGDDEYAARANNNLGIVCTLQARSEEAVACYGRALTAYRLFGWTRGIAQAHQNLGITFRDLGHYDQADSHFQSAIRYASSEHSDDEVARAEQERALLVYLARRDAQMARRTAGHAWRRFTSMGDPVGSADAQRVLAMIELGESDLAKSREHAGAALDVARATGHRLLQGEVLEVLAAAARKDRDDAGAAALEQQATAEFAATGAAEWGERFRAVTRSL